MSSRPPSLTVLPGGGGQTAPADLGARTDDELMRLTGAGIRAAFMELARRHQARLFTLCSRAIGDRDRARDLVQDVLLDLFAAAPRYEPRDRFLPFLYTLARNCIRSSFRRRRLHAVEPLPLAEGPHDMAPAAQLDLLLAKEDEVRLVRALQRLGQQERLAVLLRFQEELPYDAISRILDAPAGTVRSWVFHGVRRLRALLEGEA